MQSSLLQISSNTFYILCICVILSLIVFYVEIISPRRIKNFKNYDHQNKGVFGNKKAPSPPKLPIIGNLSVLNGYDVPYKAFSDLAEKYGPIISLKLGNVNTLVVNGIDNIRDVLITKTGHFDSRPNFRRYHQLFSGNKENSLAFCDWSDLHKFRRDMLTPHTFPRNFSNQFQKLNKIISNEMQIMLNEINSTTTTTILPNTVSLSSTSSPSLLSESGEIQIEIKPILLKSCANIFMEYFCSRHFSNNDIEFNKMVYNFDKIFYEVNQGYAADFLPFLLPLHRNNLKKMEKWSHEIRDIIMRRVINTHNQYDKNENDNENNNFVTGFLKHIQNNCQPTLDMNTALYALEDIIGGHSAIANFLIKVISYLIENPHVQIKIQEEINSLLLNNDNENKENFIIDLTHKNSMQYTQAVIMEALRLIASPIVPHVSNQDTTVNGYDVEANTLIFLNNYELSMSPKLWNEPEKFQPERFLKNSKLHKPDFFLPFGAGRRSCMGYKLVQLISFTIISNLLKNFTLVPILNENYSIQIGSLAVPEKSFKVNLIKRT